MFEQLKSLSVQVESPPTPPACWGGGHPFDCCEFEAFEDPAHEVDLYALIDEGKYQIHRIALINESGKLPNLPLCAFNLELSKIFSKLLMNLSESNPWLCRVCGIGQSEEFLSSLSKDKQVNLLWQSRRRRREPAIVCTAHGKGLEKFTSVALEDVFHYTTFAVPKADAYAEVASLLRVEGRMKAHQFARLLGRCDPIATKALDGYALCFLSRLDADELVKRARLRELERWFRRYVSVKLEKFSRVLSLYQEPVFELIDHVFGLVQQSQGSSELLDTSPVVRSFAESLLRPFGHLWRVLQSWEFRGGWLVRNRVLQMFFKVYLSQESTAWCKLEVEVPDITLREAQVCIWQHIYRVS